jgi:MFS family permease
VQSLVKRIPIVIGPIVGGLLIDRLGVLRGVRVGLAISIVMGLLSLLLQRGMKESPPASVPAEGSFWSMVKSFDHRLRWLLASDIMVRFCERLPYAWVIIYAMDQLGASATQVGLLTALETIVAMVCYIPVAHYADRHGREPFVIATFLFFTLFPASLAMAHNFALLAVAFSIRGLKEFGDPARKALIVSYARPEVRGRMIGAYYLIRDTVVSVGSLAGAALWSISPATNLYSASALGLIGTLVYWRWGRSADTSL